MLDLSSEKTAVKNALVIMGDNPAIRVISMSIGTPFSSSVLSDGVNYAYGKNKLIMAAAGTSFSWTSWWGVIYPAALTKCVAVTGVKENGRFDLVLPSGTSATLRFEKPGHLPKEVTIDTHNSTVGEPGSAERHVEFAVVLEPERWMGGLSYAGPVGSIGFDAQGGCLAVEHDKQMVLGRKQRHVTMTF